MQDNENESNFYANKEDVTDAVLPLFRELVRDYAEVSALGGRRIKFLLNTKPRQTKGRRILGSCRLFAERDRHYHDWDVEIILDKEFWETQPDKHKPLLFHELCHVAVDDETGELIQVGHDLEEFHAVWKYFGDWKGELAAANIKQLELDLAIE